MRLPDELWLQILRELGFDDRKNVCRALGWTLVPRFKLGKHKHLKIYPPSIESEVTITQRGDALHHIKFEMVGDGIHDREWRRLYIEFEMGTIDYTMNEWVTQK